MDKLDLILKKLDDHDKLFNTLDSALKQQGDMLTQLISIVASTNQKVSDMQSQINLIDERTERFDAAQARQERILEKLSARSLEQETDIENLKRVK